MLIDTKLLLDGNKSRVQQNFFQALERLEFSLSKRIDIDKFINDVEGLEDNKNSELAMTLLI